jgi:hypothetical protein
MNGPIERAAAEFRQARHANAERALADEGTSNLYAFRFTQQKKTRELVVIRTLAAEAFPSSAMAAYHLGVAAHNAGETERGGTELARACRCSIRMGGCRLSRENICAPTSARGSAGSSPDAPTTRGVAASGGAQRNGRT